MSRRFYLPPPALDGDTLAFDAQLAHRLASVLRLRSGDEVVLFDGSGSDARVRIDTLGDRAGAATVLDRCAGAPEPRVRVHLYQAITKGERFEWLIEKGTEIGVARFIPMTAARSVVKTSGEGARLDRWRRIAVEAAEQSGRSAVPQVDEPRSFEAALAGAEGVLIMPYEAAGDMAPSIPRAIDANIDTLFALGAVSLFVGPEGGFEDAEVAEAMAAGATIATIGERILRSETAGLVAATLVMHALGELG